LKFFVLEKVEKLFRDYNSYDIVLKILSNHSYDKQARDDALAMVRNKIIKEILKTDVTPAYLFNYNTLTELFTKKVVLYVTRQMMLNGKRVDGRAIDELRNIECVTNLYDSLHGSSLFQV
jgi:polyribonucleotide nucleotidyltransferase